MKKERHFGLGLYTKFILSVTIPTLITVVLFFGYYFHTYLEREKDNVYKVLTSVSQNMELQFQEIMNIGNTFYMNSDIFRSVEAMNRPQLLNAFDDLELKRLDNNYSMSLTKLMYMSTSDVVDVIFFPMDSSRHSCYYMDKRYGVLQNLRYDGYEDTAWFKEAVAADGKNVFFMKHSPFYRSSTQQKEVFSSVRAIKNMDNRKIVGVVKVDVFPSALEKALLTGVDRDDGIYILDHGKVMLSQGNVTDDVSVLQKTGYAVIGGKLCYVVTMGLGYTDWNLGYVLDLTRDLYYMVGAILLFILVFVLENILALTMFHSRTGNIVEDVEKITNALSLIENGEACPRLELDSSDEIAQIGEAVEQLSVNLKSYIDKEYVWALEQKKAEFRALQSQINPHFLYNTLNGFLALNRMGESDKLEKGIINLTRIFRYTSRSGEDTTIDRACELLREYLDLEKLKYEDRLEYSIAIEDGTHGFVLPKLLLQPLVENAIVHGMGDTDESIHIRIVSESYGNGIRISVSDDGIGFDPAILEDESHTGLRNVFERVRIFRSDVVVDLDSEEGRGTTISFIFPGGGLC